MKPKKSDYRLPLTWSVKDNRHESQDTSGSAKSTAGEVKILSTEFVDNEAVKQRDRCIQKAADGEVDEDVASHVGNVEGEAVGCHATDNPVGRFNKILSLNEDAWSIR